MYHSESGINGAKLSHNMPLINTLQAAATTLNSIKIRVDYTQPEGAQNLKQVPDCSGYTPEREHALLDGPEAAV